MSRTYVIRAVHPHETTASRLSRPCSRRSTRGAVAAPSKVRAPHAHTRSRGSRLARFVCLHPPLVPLIPALSTRLQRA
eukprot:408142-Prymnesium_polylepis.1